MKGYRMKTTNTKLIFMLLLGVLTGQSALFGAGAAGAGPGAGRSDDYKPIKPNNPREAAELLLQKLSSRQAGTSIAIAMEDNDEFALFITDKGSILKVLLPKNGPTTEFRLFQDQALNFDLLHAFASTGNTHALKAVLKNYQKIREHADYFAKISLTEKRWITDYYPRYDVPTTAGETPLMLALIKGHLETADYLYEQGASIYYKSIEEICRGSEITQKWFNEKKDLEIKKAIARLASAPPTVARRAVAHVTAAAAVPAGKDAAPTPALSVGPGADLKKRRRAARIKEDERRQLEEIERTKALAEIAAKKAVSKQKTKLAKQRRAAADAKAAHEAAEKAAQEAKAKEEARVAHEAVQAAAKAAEDARLKAAEDAKKEADAKAAQKRAEEAAQEEAHAALSESMKLLENIQKEEVRAYKKHLARQRKADARAKAEKEAEEAAEYAAQAAAEEARLNAAREAAEKAAQEAKAKEDARAAHEAALAAEAAASADEEEERRAIAKMLENFENARRNYLARELGMRRAEEERQRIIAHMAATIPF
jgi:hypothetical protein